MDLTTLDRVSTLIHSGSAASTTEGPLWTRMITALSAAAANYLNRQVQSAATTEYLSVEPGQTVFRLKAFPVTTFTSANFDPDQAWTGSALTATNYLSPLYDPAGVLTMKWPLSSDTRYPRSLKVVYTGGMAATTSTFITAYPDISNALDQQIMYAWQRKSDLGVASITGDGGTVNLVQPQSWLPGVRAVLDYHRRNGC